MHNIHDYFVGRHSVRRFSGREVSPELLNELVEEASHAPNTGNMQLYSVIATRDPEAKKRLSPMHFGQPCVEGCSVLLTFCIDTNRFARWAEVNGAEAGFDNLQMLAAAAIDCSMFAQQLNTAAEMRGLGGVFLGTTAYNAPQIAAELQLPARVIPLVALALGYPAPEEVAPTLMQDRLPVDAIIHHEKYTQYTNERIREIYAAKEARPDNQAFVSDNNLPNLARVFTDVRYPRASNEQFSATLLNYLLATLPLA